MDNPWQVESIQAFTCLKCPECSFNTKEEINFKEHAVEHHPLSFILFGKLEEVSSLKLEKNIHETHFNENIEPMQVEVKSDKPTDFNIADLVQIETEKLNDLQTRNSGEGRKDSEKLTDILTNNSSERKENSENLTSLPINNSSEGKNISEKWANWRRN